MINQIQLDNPWVGISVIIVVIILSLMLQHQIQAKFDKKKLEIDSKYFIDWNSTHTFSSIKTKTFLPFVNNKLSIGYNNHASIWCYFKIKNNNSKNTT